MTRPGVTFSRGFCQPQPCSQPKCCLLPRKDGGVRVCVAGGHCNPPGGRHLFCAQKVSQSGKNHSHVSKKDKIMRAGMVARQNFKFFNQSLLWSFMQFRAFYWALYFILTGSLKSSHFHPFELQYRNQNESYQKLEPWNGRDIRFSSDIWTIICLFHISQNPTLEKTPFSSTVFHTHSHSAIRFVASVS